MLPVFRHVPIKDLLPHLVYVRHPRPQCFPPVSFLIFFNFYSFILLESDFTNLGDLFVSRNLT